MDKKVKYAIIVLCAAAFLLAAVIGYDYLSANYNNETPTENSSSEKMKAPDFTVYDREGNPVNSSDFEGKPVVINFWATWCGYCVNEMPRFEKAFEEFDDEVVFMMINVTDGYKENKEDAVKFIEEKGYSFPVYYDEDLSAVMAYGTSSLPATAFINAEGEVVYGRFGIMSEEKLYSYIEKIL